MTEQAWLKEGEIIVREDVFNDRVPKQKIKEAIDEMKYRRCENTELRNDILFQIKELLGLEEEECITIKK